MGSQGHAHAEELRLMVNGVASGSFVREAIEKDKSVTPKAHLWPSCLCLPGLGFTGVRHHAQFMQC